MQFWITSLLTCSLVHGSIVCLAYHCFLSVIDLPIQFGNTKCFHRKRFSSELPFAQGLESINMIALVIKNHFTQSLINQKLQVLINHPIRLFKSNLPYPSINATRVIPENIKKGSINLGNKLFSSEKLYIFL